MEDGRKATREVVPRQKFVELIKRAYRVIETVEGTRVLSYNALACFYALVVEVVYMDYTIDVCSLKAYLSVSTEAEARAAREQIHPPIVRK